MNIRSKVKIIGLGLGLGDRVAGVSYAPLSSAPLVIVKSVKVVSGNCVTVLICRLAVGRRYVQSDAVSTRCCR